MRYNCDDIRRILDGPAGAIIDEKSFWDHVAACASCRSLARMPDELESGLSRLLPHPAPEWLHESIVRQASVMAPAKRSSVLLNACRFVSAALILSLIALFVISNRELLLQAWHYLNIAAAPFGIFQAARSMGAGLIGDLKPIVNLINPPFFIFGLAGIAAGIWMFSILRIRETLGS